MPTTRHLEFHLRFDQDLAHLRQDADALLQLHRDEMVDLQVFQDYRGLLFVH
ncbi:hypothetical protein D9M71_341550 [compost metagenome]